MKSKQIDPYIRIKKFDESLIKFIYEAQTSEAIDII